MCTRLTTKTSKSNTYGFLHERRCESLAVIGGKDAAGNGRCYGSVQARHGDVQEACKAIGRQRLEDRKWEDEGDERDVVHQAL